MTKVVFIPDPPTLRCLSESPHNGEPPYVSHAREVVVKVPMKLTVRTSISLRDKDIVRDGLEQQMDEHACRKLAASLMDIADKRVIYHDPDSRAYGPPEGYEWHERTIAVYPRSVATALANLQEADRLEGALAVVEHLLCFHTNADLLLHHLKMLRQNPKSLKGMFRERREDHVYHLGC